jgi:hypothetical protein
MQGTGAMGGPTKTRVLSAAAQGWREKIARKLFELERPDAVTFACPACGQGVPNFKVKISLGRDWNGVPLAPFHCLACDALLCTSGAYRWSVLCGTAALGFLIPSALRISPWYFWLGAVILSWIVLELLSSVWVKVLFPPKILKYDGPKIPKIFDNPDDLPINPWRKR